MKQGIAGLAILLFVSVAAVITGERILLDHSTPESFQTVAVTRRDIGSSVLATGVIRPMTGAEVKVGSRISGVVKALHVQIGDQINSGQLIAELDQRELDARLHQSIAAVKKAEADHAYANATLARMRALAGKDVISQQELDEAENAVHVTRAQLELARANEEYASIEAEYAQIYAPISGIVASVSTQKGETIAANFSAPTFVTIIDLNRLEVQAYVDETDIGRIHEGQEVLFTVDTYPEREFSGSVTAIYPKAVVQDNVVNYIVTIAIEEVGSEILRPEMTANVRILLETRNQVLSVPNAAVQRDRGERYVWVLENGQPEQRRVKVGWRDDRHTEIREGLLEGEKVLLDYTEVRP